MPYVGAYGPYQRDNFGRVTAKTQTLLSGTARSVGYAYASNGLLTSTTYPGGQVLQHVYDATGQITGLNWAGQALVTGITWNPLGQPTGWSWNLPGSSSAIPATRSYNTAGQLTATEFSSYLYNSAGRIYNLTQNLWKPGSTDPQENTLAQADNTWNVQYDSLGRITQMGDGVRIVTYQYDANGNRTSSVRTTVTGTPPVTNTLSRNYGTAAGHNRLLGFEQTAATTGTGGGAGSSSVLGVTYQYNAAGDLLGDGLKSYAYNSQGRVESATTGASPEAPKTKYAYNALGQRVFKTEPLYSAAGKPASTKNLNNLLADEDDKETPQEQPGLIQQLVNFFSKLWSPSTSDAEKLGWTYVYAEDGSLLAEYGEGGAATSGSAQYLWLPTANGPMPIAALIKGQTYAVHSDHLNTPRKLTQADGQVVWQWAYSAFGDEQPTTAAKRFTSDMTTPNHGSTSIGDMTFNLRYPGQYFDQETNLHYNYFRTYAPDMGRYTQGDPIGLDGGFNRFAYVGGNPLSSVDPEGLMGRGGQPGKRPPSPPVSLGANFTIGFGGSCHALPLGIGLGADSGVVLDTSGNVCVYSNICYTVGPGYAGSLGVVASANSGLASSGVTQYTGATWTGGAGLVGSGSALGGSDGSASMGRGVIGVGGGAMAGYQSCRVQYSCLKN